MLASQHLLWIDGPAGRLHTIYLPPEAPERGVAVINHPNPLHGGTFTNKVIQTAAKVYARAGWAGSSGSLVGRRLWRRFGSLCW